MVRIPIGNERSARVEVRSIGPDANPYLTLYALLKTGVEGPQGAPKKASYLPDNIYDALQDFKKSKYMKELLGADVHEKFGELKEAAADRCPRALGSRVKRGEIMFHHEVTNQFLWSKF